MNEKKPAITNGIGGQPVLSLILRPQTEITVDKEAIRKELKAARKRHTVRVKSHLP